MKIYINRFFKGIIYTGISLFFIFHEFGTGTLGANIRWRESTIEWAEKQSGFMSSLVEFLFFAIIFISLIYLIKGIYFLCTIHIERNTVFEIPISVMFSKPSTGFEDKDNIDRIKKYRDAKLSTMMNSEASEEYMKTAWIDSLEKNKGTSTQTVIRYINSKLAAKSNEEGYSWLKR